MTVFLIASLDELAIGIALLLILHFLIDMDWWAYALIVLVLIAIILIKFYIFYPHFKRPATGMEGMIGLRGRTLETLNPSGRVKIRGEIWTAKSLDGKILEGKEVEIVDAEGLELLVRKRM